MALTWPLGSRVTGSWGQVLSRPSGKWIHLMRVYAMGPCILCCSMLLAYVGLQCMSTAINAIGHRQGQHAVQINMGEWVFNTCICKRSIYAGLV